MSERGVDEVYIMSEVPNVVYVIDGHGEGWYCTGVSEDLESVTGECVHEDDVMYTRDFGG